MRLSLRTAVLTVVLAGGAASIAAAQGAPTATVDSLRRTVAALTGRLDSLEAGHLPRCPAAQPQRSGSPPATPRWIRSPPPSRC